MKYFLVSLFLLKFPVAYSFNWQRCKQVVEVPGAWTGVPGFTSVTQYSSSWGKCSMIGETSHDKKVFFAQNFENLRLDTAQGGGEYLNAYAQLSQCNDLGQAMAGKTLQKQFKTIYSGTQDDSVEESFNRLELVLKTDSILEKSCGIKQNS